MSRGAGQYVSQPTCRWCGLELAGIVETAHGAGWVHVATNREACQGGATLGEPFTIDPYADGGDDGV